MTSVLFMYSSALLNTEKWSRIILTETNICCKYIIPIIRKEYALFLFTTIWWKLEKRLYFCAYFIINVF